MKSITIVFLLFALIDSAYTMEINVNPRSIISSLDKSLAPELDILRVTTEISSDNHIVFQVKTKGERGHGKEDEYLLLQILHENVYIFLIPINKKQESEILIYHDILDNNYALSRELKRSPSSLIADLNLNRVTNGAEFLIPLDWINFGADFGFDAYTVQADVNKNTLKINKIYDQAGKARKSEKLFSAILLLNKLCAPKRLN